MEKEDKYVLITKRLLIAGAGSLLITGVLCGLTLIGVKHFFTSWFCLQCGIIGGFVSIKQRLKDMQEDELTILSKSWASVLMIPIYGGIFSLVLYMLFISGLLKGALFPAFFIPKFGCPPVHTDMFALFWQTAPLTAADFAKLAFWSFVAGFSERFVPQIIEQLSTQASDVGKKPSK